MEEMKSCSAFVLLSVLCIVSSASSLHHPRHKRQDQGEMCSFGDLITRICTNGQYEDYAYISAQCNQPENARSISDTCRFNANGDVCGAFDYTTDLQQFTSICGSSPLTNSTCSDECRSFLTDIRTRYGCCVNINNDTRGGEAVAFSYSLWSHCGVELVTEECAPTSFVMPAEIDPTCTEEVMLNERLTFRVLCRREFLDDLLDLGVPCQQLFTMDNLENPSYCAVDENGNYCSQYSGIYSANFTASNNCADTSVCDPLCIETLTNSINMFGCCFISELNSTSDHQRSYLSYEFWERCGLSSPGFCDLRIDDSPTRVSGIISATRVDTILEMSVIAVLFAAAVTLM